MTAKTVNLPNTYTLFKTDITSLSFCL